MSFVLELQNLEAAANSGPDSPSTWSLVACASTWSVVVC
ncbi:SapB/AmfS family lanthipeptide [Amycolatopsis lurida]